MGSSYSNSSSVVTYIKYYKSDRLSSLLFSWVTKYPPKGGYFVNSGVLKLQIWEI